MTSPPRRIDDHRARIQCVTRMAGVQVRSANDFWESSVHQLGQSCYNELFDVRKKRVENRIPAKYFFDAPPVPIFIERLQGAARLHRYSKRSTRTVKF